MTETSPLSLKKIRHYTFTKHHLVPTYQSASIVEVAGNLIGLHSARLSTPYVTLFSRMVNFQTKELQASSFVSRQLIRVRCMRKTLHTLPLALAPMVHQATLAFRVADCFRIYRQMEVPQSLLQDIQEDILGVVSKAPSSSQELEEHILTRRGQVNNQIRRKDGKRLIPTVIKQLWEEGTLCYLNMSDHWGSEMRVYGYTPLLYPTIQWQSLSSAEAQEKLVYSHIARFGPVTETDICWWSGLSKEVVRKSIATLRDRLCIVHLQNLEQTCYMTIEDREAFEDFRPPEDHWLCLLAYEDPSLKAYFETRTRYIEPCSYDMLFNQIGEARASIMVDGEVTGIWSWDKEKHRVVWKTFVPFSLQMQNVLDETCSRLEACLNKGVIQYSLF